MKAQILTPMFFIILSIAQAAQHEANRPKEDFKEEFEYLKKQYAFEEWREETSDSRLQSLVSLQQRLERSILLPVRITADETSLRLVILPEADLCGGVVRMACADSVFLAHEMVLEEMLVRSVPPGDVRAQRGTKYHVGDVSLYRAVGAGKDEHLSALTFARGNVVVWIRDEGDRAEETGCSSFDVVELARIIDQAIVEEAQSRAKQ